VAAPLPPGPKGHFLSGNLPEFGQDALGFLERCAREYGDVFALRLGPRRIVLLNHPDYIEEVLVTSSRNFTKHFAKRYNSLVLGNGLLSSEGDFWLRQRRMAQPAFNRGSIAPYAPVMVAYTERMLETWREGETRDLHVEMMQLALGIVAKTLFDADVAGDARDVGVALDTALESFLARLNSVFALPPRLPTPKNLRLWRAVRRLDEVIYGFIKQRRASGEDRGDLLSLLLHAHDEDDGSQMTDRQLRDEAMTLFLAGYETTALALSWTGYLLARHPEVDARLAAELQGLLGGRSPTVADYPRLKYTEKVITESMRLYPPAYVVGRQPINDFLVGGYRIPAGRTIWLSQWLVHHDPRFFDEPGKFNPDRWTETMVQRLPKYAYFPFGGGPRICIGNSFAMMEMILVLATVGQKFRFTLAPGEVVRPRPSFTLRPDHGVKVVLSRR
jgi:cytochrome P450